MQVSFSAWAAADDAQQAKGSRAARRQLPEPFVNVSGVTDFDQIQADSFDEVDALIATALGISVSSLFRHPAAKCRLLIHGLVLGVENGGLIGYCA